MLARTLYLLWLASIPATTLLILAGLWAAQVRLLVGGVAAGIVGWATRQWLRQRTEFEVTAEAFDAVTWLESDTSTESPKVARLITLLREWDALESRRGTLAFDPWSLQAVRSEVHALVDSEPALASLFRGRSRSG